MYLIETSNSNPKEVLGKTLTSIANIILENPKLKLSNNNTSH